MPGWAVYTDLSGVAPVDDGHWDSEEQALRQLVYHAESNKTDIVVKIARAKRRLRDIKRRKPT